MENSYSNLSHDDYQEFVFKELIKIPEFKNFYQTRIVRDFPKPDIILIERTKVNERVFAFEFKPPYCNKREYLTGIGQSLVYYYNYPYSYLIIPDQNIDGINIPYFISEIIQKTNSPLGLIKYNVNNYIVSIIKPSTKNLQIDKKRLEEEIIKKSSSWSFWMDTSIDEVGEILLLIDSLTKNKRIPTNDREFIMNEIWSEILTNRYKTQAKGTINSFKLNYQLFFDHLNVWSQKFELTKIGNRLKEIVYSYGVESNEFNDALSYLLLTEGKYLQFYRHMHEIQSLNKFEYRGKESKLLSEIRHMRVERGVDKNSYEIDDKIVDDFFENGDEWLRIIPSILFRNGFGKGITQILSDVSHKIPYMDSKLKTNFLLDHYSKGKGYPINWMRIIKLLEKGKENLNVL